MKRSSLPTRVSKSTRKKGLAPVQAHLDYVVFPLEVRQAEPAGHSDDETPQDVEPRIPGAIFTTLLNLRIGPIS